MSRAADVPVPLGPSFEGFYLGAFGGYAAARFEGEVDSNSGDEEDMEIFEDSWTGAATLGGYLGYNFQADNLMFGVELDAGIAQIDDEAKDNDTATDIATSEIDWYGSARLRLGLAAGESTLVYATGGLGYIATTFFADNNSQRSGDSGDESIGYYTAVAGGGVEHMLNESFALRVEGLYYFPTEDYEFDEDQLTTDMDEGDYIKVNGFYQLRAGLTFRF